MFPVVTEEAKHALLKDLESVENQYEVFKDIQDEQPELADMIRCVLYNDGFNKDFKEGYLQAASQFYALLRNQAESDEMDEAWD